MKEKVLLFGNRPLAISSAINLGIEHHGCLLDEDLAIKLGFPIRNLQYVHLSLIPNNKDKRTRVVGTVRATVQTIENGRPKQSMAFSARVVRDLFRLTGADALADETFSNKLGLDSSNGFNYKPATAQSQPTEVNPEEYHNRETFSCIKSEFSECFYPSNFIKDWVNKCPSEANEIPQHEQDIVKEYFSDSDNNSDYTVSDLDALYGPEDQYTGTPSKPLWAPSSHETHATECVWDQGWRICPRCNRWVNLHDISNESNICAIDDNQTCSTCLQPYELELSSVTGTVNRVRSYNRKFWHALNSQITTKGIEADSKIKIKKKKKKAAHRSMTTYPSALTKRGQVGN